MSKFSSFFNPVHQQLKEPYTGCVGCQNWTAEPGVYAWRPEKTQFVAMETNTSMKKLAQQPL